MLISLRLVIDLALADSISAERARGRITLTAELEVVVAARSGGRDGEVSGLVDIASLALVLPGEGLLGVVDIEDGCSGTSAGNSDDIHVLGSSGSRNCNMSTSSDTATLVLGGGGIDAIASVNSAAIAKALVSTLVATAPLFAPLHDDLAVAVTLSVLDALGEAALRAKIEVTITNIANHSSESTISELTLGIMAVDLSTIGLAKILGETAVGAEDVGAVAIRVISGFLVAVLGLVPAVSTGNTVEVEVPETGGNRRISLRASVENVLPSRIARGHTLLEIGITEVDRGNTDVVEPGARCTLVVRSKVLLGRAVGNTVLRPVLLSNFVLARNTSNSRVLTIRLIEDGLGVAVEALLNTNSSNSNCCKNNKRLGKHLPQRVQQKKTNLYETMKKKRRTNVKKVPFNNRNYKTTFFFKEKVRKVFGK